MSLSYRIVQDTDPQSPEDWGNEDLFLITTKNRYFQVTRKGFDFDSLHKDEYHAVPLYAYIHGGIVLSVEGFSDPWDSGQIGYVMVKKNAGFRNIKKAAQSLVTEWNQYLSGDVWGYVIEREDESEVDSCWGFYGREYAEHEALEQLKFLEGLEAAKEKKIEQAFAS